MKQTEYGMIPETAAERRELLRRFTKDGANRFIVACEDCYTMPIETVNDRRERLKNADSETLDAWTKCNTIGTPWIIWTVSTSELGRLPAADYETLFDSKGRFKVSAASRAIVQKYLAKGTFKIIHKGDDFCKDLAQWYNGNFGWALECFLSGNENHTRSRVDALNAQIKCSFSTFRLHNEYYDDGTLKYGIATRRGMSTANGIM